MLFKKKSVRTFATITGNKESLRTKRIDRNTICYCRWEIQLKLRSRIVRLRQWQSQGRRKWFCTGGSLPTCRISTWDTPQCRRSRGSRCFGKETCPNWPHFSVKTSAFALCTNTQLLHKQPRQECGTEFGSDRVVLYCVKVTSEVWEKMPGPYCIEDQVITRVRH